MPNITLTLGASSYTHTISAGDSTRIISAVAAQKGVAATAAAVCPVLAREFFLSLKRLTQGTEHAAVVISDIPATES